MKKFLIALCKFAIFPGLLLLAVIVGYLVFDPFNVLYLKEHYSEMQVSKDFASTESFLKNYPQQKYDSFIFGSSRTMGYLPSSWKKYLPEESSVFLYDAYGENIYGIWRKVLLLDSMNVEIKNVMLTLDEDATLQNTEPRTEFYYAKHPMLTGQSQLSFQWNQFISYLDANMILRYYSYRLFDIKNQWVMKYLANVRTLVDPLTNETTRPDLEKRILTEPDFFNKPYFYGRPAELQYDQNIQIKAVQFKMLEEISNILKKHNTDYKIVINPIYNQKKYNPKDMEILFQLFGAENIYDFSGKNHFTEDKHNFYENSHFRPLVGDSVISLVYSYKPSEMGLK